MVEAIAIGLLGDLLEMSVLDSLCVFYRAHSPSTRTFLFLMATLTPSGMASSSSEWLFRTCQQKSWILMFARGGICYRGAH